MEFVVLLLLFAWLISTAIMTVRSGSELRERDAGFNPPRLSSVTAPMHALSTSEAGDSIH